MHVKKAQATVEIKCLELKWAIPKNNIFVPDCDLKYSISVLSKRNLFPIKYFYPYFIWFGPIFLLFYTWVEADAAHATPRSKYFEAQASRWLAQAADGGVGGVTCFVFFFL